MIQVTNLGTPPTEGYSRLMMLNGIENENKERGLGGLALGPINIFVVLGLGLAVFGGIRLLTALKKKRGGAQ